MNDRASPLLFSLEEIREKQGLHLQRSVDAAALCPRPDPLGQVRFEGALETDIEFSIGGDRILLQLAVRGRWALPCSRCLRPHVVDFSGHAEEVYPSSEGTLDIWPNTLEAALLEIPHRSLCHEDCRGICSHCGKNLNEGGCSCEHRPPGAFDALRALKDRAPDPRS